MNRTSSPAADDTIACEATTLSPSISSERDTMVALYGNDGPWPR